MEKQISRPSVLSPKRRWSRSGWLLGCVALLATACTGRQILEEHSELKPTALFAVMPKSNPLKLQKGLLPDQKFHAGLRLSEGFLNRAMVELLKAEIIPSTFDAPVSISMPPFSTQVTFRPSVQGLNPSLKLTGTCAECLTVSLDFVGRFGVEVASGVGAPSSKLFDGTALQGSILLSGRLIPTYTGGVPSVAVQLEPFRDGDLRLTVNMPVPGIDTLVTSAMRSQMQKALLRPDLNTFALLSLKQLTLPDSSIAVNEVVFRTSQQPEPELQLGMNFNLTTAPEVTMASFQQPLRKNDFAMRLGETTLTDLIKVWLAEGWLPGTFNTSGDSDPNGKITVDLRSFKLFDDRYEAVTRFWHTGSPPFWREYKLGGTIGVRSDAIQMSNQKAELISGKGPNGLIDLALLTQGVNLSKTLGDVGKRLPRTYGFPFGTPTKLEAQIALEEIQTEGHAMSTYHSVSWVPGTGGLKQ